LRLMYNQSIHLDVQLSYTQTMNTEENIQKARELIEQNRHDEARMCLLEVLKDDPTNKAALIILGGSYFSMEKYAEAEMVFERLILLEPGVGRFSIGLFNTLWKMNRQEEALEEIKRFLSHADQELENETIGQYIAVINHLENGDDLDDDSPD
jgi:tetratricopeptide (TPR) repeat protein